MPSPSPGLPTRKKPGTKKAAETMRVQRPEATGKTMSPVLLEHR